MGGGHFDYNQRRILDIRDSIIIELDNQGKDKPVDERWDENDVKYMTHPLEVADKMREAIKSLERAYIYTVRVDYLLSGDIGYDTFLEGLKEDLKTLKK